jgi:hypothetical protein
MMSNPRRPGLGRAPSVKSLAVSSPAPQEVSAKPSVSSQMQGRPGGGGVSPNGSIDSEHGILSNKGDCILNPYKLLNFGRSTPPPIPGSSYDDFLMWACDGVTGFGLEDIALELWAGLIPNPTSSRI